MFIKLYHAVSVQMKGILMMKAISNVNLQSQSMNYSKNARVAYMKQSDIPQGDSVTISNPAFKGTQVIQPKQMGKGKLALMGIATAVLGGVMAKINANSEAKRMKEKEAEIADKAQEIVKMRHQGDRCWHDSYTQEEANGIAQFMDDEPIYNSLLRRLEPCECIIPEESLTTDEVLYLGNKLKEDTALVDKLDERCLCYGGYKEVVDLLKLRDADAKTVDELLDKFKNLSGSEIMKVIDTYKKYPQETAEMLNAKDALRDIRSHLTYSLKGDYASWQIDSENDYKKVDKDFKKLFEIAPDDIKAKIKPMYEGLVALKADNKRMKFPIDSIPKMSIDYVISSVNDAKLNEREIEVMELYPDYQ